MAEPPEITHEHQAAAEPRLSLRERGARTIHALAELTPKLYPLQQKQRAGEPLTDTERRLLDELETEYRRLETELRLLMRPRVRPVDVQVAGADHLHGPEGVVRAEH